MTTTGIGENSAEVRHRVRESSARVIPTNEEVVIARHMDAVLGLNAC